MEDSIQLKVPPHSLEAEESIIGGCFLDPECFERIAGQVSYSDFYYEKNAVVFRAVADLAGLSEPVDIVTVSERLKMSGDLEKVGGISGLAEQMERAVTTANVERYADIVREKALLRRAIQRVAEVTDQLYSTSEPPSVLLDRAESALFEIGGRKQDVCFSKIDSLVVPAVDRLEAILENPSAVTGLESGFDTLDCLTAGFQKGDLIIVAARPSMGKTALVLNMAENISVPNSLTEDSVHSVGIFSLEMGKEQLVQRMLCSKAEIDMYDLRAGRCTPDDKRRIAISSGMIGEAEIFIDDTPAISATELRAKARRMARTARGGLDLIVVDYLQLMRGAGTEQSREQEIANISRSLKSLAKELHVPVIALSQLNRSVEARVDKRPCMADLRDSGQIEQDADVVLLIYRDEVYNPQTLSPGIAELIIAKQRNGATGVAEVGWNARYTKFTNR